MTIPFAQVDLRFGLVRARDFTNVGVFQPWPGQFQRAHVAFEPPFPDDDVRVFVTATNEDLGPTDHHAAVVGVVDSVTNDGFDLFARSTDCASGSSSFTWLAVWGKALDAPRREVIELRMARVQPGSLEPKGMQLSPDCTPGDTGTWPTVPFSRPIVDGQGTPLDPTILLTQSHSLLLTSATFKSWAACVGMLRGDTPSGFNLTARNFDLLYGFPTYHYLALARSDQGPVQSKVDELRVAMGEATFSLMPGGPYKSWADRPVYFDAPFITPPIILLTARSAPGMGVSDVRAFHPVASTPDQWGFTLMARSADPEFGTMNVNWLALGCGEACGG
jgi:hypothetical protein